MLRRVRESPAGPRRRALRPRRRQAAWLIGAWSPWCGGMCRRGRRPFQPVCASLRSCPVAARGKGTGCACEGREERPGAAAEGGTARRATTTRVGGRAAAGLGTWQGCAPQRAGGGGRGAPVVTGEGGICPSEGGMLPIRRTVAAAGMGPRRGGGAGRAGRRAERRPSAARSCPVWWCVRIATGGCTRGSPCRGRRSRTASASQPATVQERPAGTRPSAGGRRHPPPRSLQARLGAMSVQGVSPLPP